MTRPNSASSMTRIGRSFSYLLIVLFFGFISACGGDGPLTTVGTGGAITTTTVATGTNGTTVSLGSGTGGGFTAGVLALGVTSLSAGGSTSVTAVLQDSAGILYQTSTSVVFSSTCVAFGTASMTSPVVTATGVAITSYSASGCTGADLITASVTIGGTLLTATATVTVAAATIGSIQFISATPSLIALQGTGGSGLSETATIKFKVLDQTGGPVAGATVNFALSTSIGGLTRLPTSATSGVDGIAQTTVQSGTVPTSVRITASTLVGATTISTQSDNLVISTGIPDQDSFSLAATILNPEGRDHDGVTSLITSRLSDRFNNPVPDGTTVYFTTEGGSIQSACTTTGGACSVTWTSSNPRPCGNASGNLPNNEGDTVVLAPNLGPNQCVASAGTNATAPQGTDNAGNGLAVGGGNAFTAPWAGRATITATAVGEESFLDLNGNGIYDGVDTFVDLPEAWRDEDEDGVRDTLSEMFMDFNNDGVYTAGDGMFNGVLCTLNCSATTSIHVRRQLVLVMSGSNAQIEFFTTSARTAVLSTFTVNGTASREIFILISDVNNQPIPAGSTVAIATSQGSIPFGGGFTMTSTSANSPVYWSFTVEGAVEAPDAAKSGVVSVTVTTPLGLISFDSIPFTDAP